MNTPPPTSFAPADKEVFLTSTCAILLPALARLAGRELCTADCHLLDSTTSTKLSFHIATPLVLVTPEARLEFYAWVAEHITPVGAPLIDCGVYGAARNMRLSFCTKTGSSARLVPTERVGALKFAACAPQGVISPAVLVDHLWTAILPCDARNVVSADAISAQRSAPVGPASKKAAPFAAAKFSQGPRDGTSLTEAQFYDVHGCTFEQYLAAATSALQSAGVPRLPEAARASTVKRVGDGRLYWFTTNRHTCCHGNVHEDDNYTTRLVQGAVQRACYAEECMTKDTSRPGLDWRTICYVAKDASSGLQPAFRREFGPSLTALGFVLSFVNDVEPTSPTASRFAYSAPCAMCPERCVHPGAFYASIATDGLVTVHAPRSACSSPPVCAVAGSRKTRFPPTDFALYRPLLEAVLGVPTLEVVESAVCRLVNWKGISANKRRRDPVPSRFLRHWQVTYCKHVGEPTRTKHFHLADDGSLWESFAPETLMEMCRLDFSTESPGPDSPICEDSFQQLSSWFDGTWGDEFARLGVVKRSACDYDLRALLLAGVLPWVHLARIYEFCT